MTGSRSSAGIRKLHHACVFVSEPTCRGRSSKPIFVQIAKQVVSLNPLELRLPSRAWKVKLIGEGADDAGGVFDDTITEMCQVKTKREKHTYTHTKRHSLRPHIQSVTLVFCK